MKINGSTVNTAMPSVGRNISRTCALASSSSRTSSMKLGVLPFSSSSTWDLYAERTDMTHRPMKAAVITRVATPYNRMTTERSGSV